MVDPSFYDVIGNLQPVMYGFFFYMENICIYVMLKIDINNRAGADNRRCKGAFL